MPVNGIIHEKNRIEQAASRVQTRHLAYKSGIWRTKLAFRLQICSFQFTNKYLVLQTGVSDYNSARDYSLMMIPSRSYRIIIKNFPLADKIMYNSFRSIHFINGYLRSDPQVNKSFSERFETCISEEQLNTI